MRREVWRRGRSAQSLAASFLMAAFALTGCIFGINSSSTGGESTSSDTASSVSDSGTMAGGDAAGDADAAAPKTRLRRQINGSKWFRILKQNESDDIGLVAALHLFDDGSAVFSGCAYHTGRWELAWPENTPPRVNLENMTQADCRDGTESPPEYAEVIGPGPGRVSKLALKGTADATLSLDLVASGSDRLDREELIPRWEGEDSTEIDGRVRTVTVFLEVRKSGNGALGYTVSGGTRRFYRNNPVRVFDQSDVTYWTIAPEQPLEFQGTEIGAVGGRIEWRMNAEESRLYAPLTGSGSTQNGVDSTQLEYVSDL